MTVYKAFKNFFISLLVLTVLLAATAAGAAAYAVNKDSGESTYAISKLGSSGDEVKSIQRKLIFAYK